MTHPNVIPDAVYDALRSAVNDAVKAGLSLNEVRSVVHDQLFGIEHFGGGDVDKMLAVEAEAKYRNRNKFFKE